MALRRGTAPLGGWGDEYQVFRTRDLSDRDYVYIWADGVHFNIRLEEDRLVTLVILGARPDGTNELIAVEDGFRESAESWSAVLRDLKQRGMRAPELAVGDDALGFRAALRDVWPQTREQRDWLHRIGKVLDKLLTYFDFRRSTGSKFAPAIPLNQRALPRDAFAICLQGGVMRTS